MPSRAALWWLPLLLALSFRLLNAVCSRAYFQPDEYWQNLEVAHRWIYGYGYQTWEWRSTPGDGEKWGSSAAEDIAHLLRTGGHGGIRSPLSVVVTAAVYALLKALAWDSGNLLVLAPRLAQACIAASADLAVRRLATRLLGPSYANAALFVSLTSFFNFHTSTRTFSNATETALTAWALALWPWGLHRMSTATRLNGPKRPRPRWQGSLAAALGLAALASLIRPSNAVIWLALGAQLLFRVASRDRITVIGITVSIGLIAGLFSFALDSAFYGTPTLTPLRFLHTNVVQSISLFYGANAWHFYLSQGLPILLVTQLPFCLRGLFRLGEGEERLGALRRTVGATLAAYSLLSHKEWRFLHPLLPALHIFVARCLVHSDLAFTSKNGRKSAATAWIQTQLRIRPAHAGWVALSLLPALYLTAFHGIAQNRVMGHLRAALERDAAVRGGGGGGGSEVGFLMPCHSTGWQAFLHRPEMEEPLSLVDGSGNGRRRRRMWMVTCEPPVSGQDPSTYADESDLFYADPCAYLSSRLLPPAPSTSSPSDTASPLRSIAIGTSRVVLFSSLLKTPCPHPLASGSATVGELLQRDFGYSVREWEGWNTLGGWHEDERRRGTVIVLRRVSLDGDGPGGHVEEW